MKKLYFLLTCLVLSCSLFGQTTVTIYAGTGGMPHDDSVTGNASTSGGSGAIRKKDTILCSGFQRGYGVFDLSSIPVGASILNCKIGFNVLHSSTSSTTWNTYGYAGDLSLVTSATTLYADCIAGTSLTTATYGTTVGNKVLTATAGGDAFLQSHEGSKISVCWTSGATSAGYTIRGESGVADTGGDHTPYLQLTYCNLPAISGLKAICPGSSTTYTINDSVGTWTTSSYVATINPVTGVLNAGSGVGTVVVIYTVGSCTVKDTVAVEPLPAITGLPTVCMFSSTTLSNSVAGGTWSSSITSVATVDSVSGVVLGESPGTTVITYKTAPGCTVTTTVNVSPNPNPITGNPSVCTGSLDTLTETIPGGIWSTTAPSSIATVSSSGVVTGGTSTGVATIMYAIGPCMTTFTVTVISTPASITPSTPVSVCVGATTLLSDVTPGGTWTTSDATVASVNSGGTVTGMATGTATITYGAGGVCSVTKPVTVVGPLPISAPTSFVCAGGTVLFSDPTAGGTWSSGAGTIATVDGGGTVTGVSLGTTQITYTQGGCSVWANASVFDGAGTIQPSGSVSLCAGNSMTMTDTPTVSGTWSSSASGIATIDPASGVVTGMAAGTATITFTASGGCYTTQTISITTGASALSPSSASICVGATTTFTDPSGGGVWSTSAPTVATVAGGIVTGLTSGVATISYSIGGCSALATVTVSTPPAAITPPSIASVCMGSTVSLGDATPGGAWSSGSGGVATVSGTGVVTGLSIGSATISYTVGGCSAIKVVNVTSGPGPISPNPATVCLAGTSTLTDPTGGGVWSSSNPFVATVTSGGVVSGVALGTVNISYSLGACVVIDPVTVSAPPSAITVTGATSICIGGTTNVSDATAGGSWSSSPAGVVSISGAGLVTGTSAGTATVSYSLGSCIVTTTIVVNATPAAISPSSATLCTGTSTSLFESVGGGAWSSTAPGVATVSTTGSVTGLTTGTATISYSIGSCVATAAISVNLSASGGVISGPAVECVGSSAIVLTDTASGGTWSSSSSAIASVSGGVVTGISGGVANITYTVINSCGTSIATHMVTINTSPTAGSIVGSSLVCAGTYTTLSDIVAGGTWTSSNATASITSTGLLTGITPGTDTITYTVVASCGTALTKDIITIGPYLSAGFISGPTSVCVGATIPLADPATGGVWTTLYPGIAGVSPTGVVTGNTPGADTIYYTVSSSCGSATAKYEVTVNPLIPPVGAISGASVVCTGGTTTLSETISGGSWSASNTHASITGGGVVSGVSVGTDTIRYTVVGACGTGVATFVITISTTPTAGTITGPTSVCSGSSIVLTDLITGGTWTSGSANATVGLTTGVVNGISSGTAVITYTVTNACGTASTTTTVTVNPTGTAGTISGPDSVCVGSNIVLTDPVAGGVWTAGNANATVSSGGVVTGMAGGTTPITYTVTTACGTAMSVRIVYITALPTVGAIFGIPNVCIGSGITWTVSSPGGTWAASNTHASVVPPGIVDGISIGVDTIFYEVTTGCGTASAYKIVSVNPVPVVTPIIGPTEHCLGSSLVFTDATPGGVWTSSNPSVASIGLTTGTSMGVSLGVATLTYTVTNSFGCPTSVLIQDTVIAVPVIPAITGSTHVCLGSTITLGDSLAGGTWSSSNPSIANISPSAGSVTGFIVGSVTITYTVLNVCGLSSVTRTEDVTALPIVPAITGTAIQCIGATSTLTDGLIGGVWSSADTTIAKINSSSGVVTGIAAGTVTMYYTYTNMFACSTTVSRVDTVNGLPFVAAIAGTTHECIGATTSLSDVTTGGVWSSSNPLVATVNSSGTVTGVSAGIATISYSVTIGCTGSATVRDTVIAPPSTAPVTGVLHACVGGTTTLANAVPYGAWSSGNTAIATVVSGSGVVTGVAAGTDKIYYTVTNGCGSPVIDSATITINPIPSAGTITAAYTTLCSGTTVTLGESLTGGTWSSADTTIAIVNSTTGLVTGVSAGVVNIIYTVNSSFGCTNSTSLPLTINGASLAATLTPSGIASLCHGVPVVLHVTASGVTYEWLRNSTIIPGATDSVYTATSAGIYTVVISNGICSRTLPSINIVTMAVPAISFTAPDILYTSSYYAYQWFKNGVAIVGATSNIFHETGAGVYKVEVWDAAGCFDTSVSYTVSGSGTNGVNTIVGGMDIKVYPNPASTMVHIDAPVKVNVSVLSIDGKLLIEQKDAGNVDVSNLANGMYIIMVYDDNRMLLKTTKFAKVE